MVKLLEIQLAMQNQRLRIVRDDEPPSTAGRLAAMYERHKTVFWGVVLIGFAMTILSFNRNHVDENLRGIWKLEWVQSNGSPKRRERQLWVFRHGTLTIVSDRNIDDATTTIDPSRSPKHIDTNQAVFSTGIYEVNGDVLRMSQVILDLPRPTEFETVQGDFRTVTLFKRVAASPQIHADDLHALLISEFGPRNEYPARREFDDQAEELIGDLVRNIYDRRGELTEKEEVISQIDRMVTEVNNGGFHQYFYNCTGDHAVETAVLLRKLSAPETASLVETGCALFPDKMPSKDHQERRVQLERFTLDQLEVLRDLENRFYSRSEDIYLLLKRYWEEIPNNVK